MGGLLWDGLVAARELGEGKWCSKASLPLFLLLRLTRFLQGWMIFFPRLISVTNYTDKILRDDQEHRSYSFWRGAAV